MDKPKTIDGLMLHLRNQKIQISGSKQKRILTNIGYYHGYKGYRFLKTKNNPLPITDFDQLNSIYKYDSELKALFYPYVMAIETAIKNIAIDVVCNYVRSSRFIDIYEKGLTEYKQYLSNKNDKKFLDAVKRRNSIRENYYNISMNQYQHKNDIAVHFQNKDMDMPLWAWFELITLGDFGYFLTACNSEIKYKISEHLKINPKYNTNGRIPEKIIFCIKDLRNAIAHNRVIYDLRFQKKDINDALMNMLTIETKINVRFSEIVDYLILLIFILKKLGYTKTELKSTVLEFKTINEKLRKTIPISMYNKFVSTDFKNKLELLNEFIKKS